MGAEEVSGSSSRTSSILLELAAMDDVDTFKLAVEQSGLPIDEVGLWYTRRIGSNKMSYENRTPLMVAALYGSTKVLDYILESTGSIDVNRAAGSDRVTALHCAVAGGSSSSPFVVDRLIKASANLNSLDSNGNKPSDLIPNLLTRFSFTKQLETLLQAESIEQPGSPGSPGSPLSTGSEKKDYPVELPDINNGVYGSDEFRMYCFKIKPCSRAYTHDWTECPFAHPGENARRRDPKKYQYTCVPCPEFKKGTCKKGDECEFAHGVFESWLHPAQYRTRLCKDETGCSRKVCFFAHKKEDLRPVYLSTGSAIPGPDMGSTGGGSSGGMSTPPLSPSFSPKSGGGGGGSPMWQGKPNNLGVPPPSLQLPGSRLRSSLSARDVEFERELLKLESQISKQQQQYHQQMLHHHQQQILSPRPSPTWSNNRRAGGDLSPANLDSVFASINVPRKLSPPNVLLDSSPKAVATAMLNSRASAFAKRSQSFIDRSAPPASGGYTVGNSGASLSSTMSANLGGDWGSPNGKLDWGVQREELHKLRKSNSFGFRGNGNNITRTSSPPGFSEPDVSWVNSLVKDDPSGGLLGQKMSNYGSRGARNGVQVPGQWGEQVYIEQEQLVA